MASNHSRKLPSNQNSQRPPLRLRNNFQINKINI
nr:MAG TPA: hypothetical protein [Caudoviricetes sp.]